jgi:cytochrome P450
VHPAELDRLLASPGFLQDPHPTWKALRTEDPVHWCEPWQAWVITRYEDVDAVHRDFRRFRNFGRSLRYLKSIPPELVEEFRPFENFYSNPGFDENDPPDHTRIRALAMKAFTPRAIEQLRDDVTALANDLIDDVIERGSADLVCDFAAIFSPAVIGRIMGLPRNEVPQFKAWTRRATEYFGQIGLDAAVLRRSQAATIELTDWLHGLIAERRRRPTGDLLSDLVSAEDHGEFLSDRELEVLAVELMVAGDETTANLIPSGFLNLLRHPDQMRGLRQDAGLLKDAIDEMLRFEPPFPLNHRIAAEDVELGGKQIRGGDYVRMSIASANRDPGVFLDPEGFDIRRRPNKHLAFGAGPHFCIGHSLARMDLEIAFSALLARLDDPGLATDHLSWYAHSSHRGLLTLPITYQPGPRRGGRRQPVP